MAKNAVAIKEEAGLPVDADFLNDIASQDEGEKLSREDVSIPFLRILQDLSPQVKETKDQYIEGAKPGMLLNTVTNELYTRDDVVEIIPIHYKASYIEWVPRKDGGGMVREYSLAEGKNVEQNFTVRDDNNNDVIQRGAPEPFTPGNHLLFTHTHVVKYRVNGGAWKAAVISMNKTQLKPSRQLNALIQDAPINGKVIRYAHLMKASTQLVTKGDDSWFIWHFDREAGDKGFASKDDILAARDFRKALVEGEVKVDMSKSVDDDTGDTPSASKTVDELDEEVPF